MTKKTGLGRGLGALIRDTAPDNESSDIEQIKSIDIELIYPREDQPRKQFDDETIVELAKSISDHGILQPLLLREVGDKFEIIAGERRYRAAKIAGLKEVPALIKDVKENIVKEISIIENIQREDLNPIEEALAYEELLSEYNLTQEKLAAKVGKSRSYIANTLRLLGLDDYIKEYLIKGEITSSQGRTLLSIKNPLERKEYLNKLLENKINIREIERRAKKKYTGKVDIFIKDMEERFTEVLATKVKLIPGKKGGKIEISYFSNEDLDRIYEFFKEENYG